MSAQTIITDAGRAALATAIANNQPLPITSFQVGDSISGTLSPGTTALLNPRYTGTPAGMDARSETNVAVECVVPAYSGGYTVREIGLFSGTTLICYGSTPEIEKPLLENGAVGDLVLTVILTISRASAITLQTDPAIAVATRQYVDNHINSYAAVYDLFRASDWLNIDLDRLGGTYAAGYQDAPFNSDSGYNKIIDIASYPGGIVVSAQNSSSDQVGVFTISDSGVVSNISTGDPEARFVDCGDRIYYGYQFLQKSEKCQELKYDGLTVGDVRCVLGAKYLCSYSIGVPTKIAMQIFTLDGTHANDNIPLVPYQYCPSAAYSPKLDKICVLVNRQNDDVNTPFNRSCYIFNPNSNNVGQPHDIQNSFYWTDSIPDLSIGKIVWDPIDDCFVVCYPGEYTLYWSYDGVTWYNNAVGSNIHIYNVSVDTGLVLWTSAGFVMCQLPKLGIAIEADPSHSYQPQWIIKTIKNFPAGISLNSLSSACLHNGAWFMGATDLLCRSLEVGIY